jgi:hypothetical protein
VEITERETVLADALMILRDEVVIDEIEHIPGELQASIEQIEMMVDMLPNPNLHWEEWNRYGMALHAASGGSEEGRGLFHRFSAKSDKYNEKKTEARWEHYHKHPPNRIGFGTLYYEAMTQYVEPEDDWAEPDLDLLMMGHSASEQPKPNGAEPMAVAINRTASPKPNGGESPQPAKPNGDARSNTTIPIEPGWPPTTASPVRS